MTPADVGIRRLDAQRISATTFERPGEVVAWLGAVQAQDYLGALWSVGLRLEGAREGQVERAIADRAIVRTWPLRGTLHFVARADARWMIELGGARAVARAEGRFRALGLDAATFARARRALGRALQGGKALLRGKVSVSWSPFAPPTQVKRTEMARACRRYAAFLGVEAQFAG